MAPRICEWESISASVADPIPLKVITTGYGPLIEIS